MKTFFSLLMICVIGNLISHAQTFERAVIDDDIQLIHLQDSIFIHLTWHKIDYYGRFPSNGLLIIKNGEALMIDTPMDNDKTKRLTQYLKDSMHVDLTKLVIGHFHDDCLGGLEYLQKEGVESIANSLTIEKCKDIGLPIPLVSFSDSLSFDFNGQQISCRYFGPAHSLDNITVWLPSQKILFAGCLIKSLDSKGLGNLEDALVTEWGKTINNIALKYPEISIVIPGHGTFGGRDLLKHTTDLVNIELSKRKED